MFVLCNDFIVYMFDAIYFAFNFKINFGMENHAFYNMSYIFKHKAVNMPKESKDKITYMYNLSKREKNILDSYLINDYLNHVKTQ